MNKRMHIHDRITTSMDNHGKYLGTIKAGGKIVEDFVVDTPRGRTTLIAQALVDAVDENLIRDNEKFVVIIGRDKMFSDVSFLVYRVSKNLKITDEMAQSFFKEFTKEDVMNFRAYRMKH